mmetsp:Transcript_15300/g.23211  ORF Transcript_15300/g.23211 Transcript_15300/m.23211 type:complete len:108 (+) Transcript_15300:634-957(+)
MPDFNICWIGAHCLVHSFLEVRRAAGKLEFKKPISLITFAKSSPGTKLIHITDHILSFVLFGIPFFCDQEDAPGVGLEQLMGPIIGWEHIWDCSIIVLFLIHTSGRN